MPVPSWWSCVALDPGAGMQVRVVPTPGEPLWEAGSRTTWAFGSPEALTPCSAQRASVELSSPEREGTSRSELNQNSGLQGERPTERSRQSSRIPSGTFTHASRWRKQGSFALCPSCFLLLNWSRQESNPLPPPTPRALKACLLQLSEGWATSPETHRLSRPPL